MGIPVEKHQKTSKWEILFIEAAFGGRFFFDISNSEIMVSKGKSLEISVFLDAPQARQNFAISKWDFFGLRNRLLFYSQINGNSDKWEFRGNL